jgi:glycine/D-amino acid oxidase-like deaminating enzyme
LLGYQLEPGSLPRILRRGHTYILQRSSGFTIAGSNEQRIGFDRHVDEHICHEIEERAAELWPRLRNETPVRRWIGFRPSTENMELQMRRIPETNVWLAYGHFRNGILLAPVTAQRIAAEIIASLGTD